MNEFLTNTVNFIGQIHWSTWVALIIFIGFGMRGFKRGMAKELIGLGFMILAFVVAYLCYQSLSNYAIITLMSLSKQSNMLIAFGVIFAGVQLLKMVLYSMTKIASEITDPCVLNKSFLVALLLIATVGFGYYIELSFNLNALGIMLNTGLLHASLSFFFIFFTAIGLLTTISKLFDSSINASSPCFLGTIIQHLLNMMTSLDDKLNATNNTNENNQLFGAIIGLAKGFIFIIVTLLILQSIDAVTQKNYWIESENSLRIFHDVASETRAELSEHLHFIKKD